MKRRPLILALASIVLTLSSFAANVSVSGSSTGLEPGATGGTMTIGVTSDDPAPPATENLTAWQLSLIIVPDGGAAGTVSFSMVMPPSPYILNGINIGISPTISTTTNNTLVAFDLNFPFSGGVPEPVAPGSGLADITFTASAGATGVFGLFAMPGVGNSVSLEGTAPVGSIYVDATYVVSVGAVAMTFLRVAPEEQQ
jgi:hypothetical protein